MELKYSGLFVAAMDHTALDDFHGIDGWLLDGSLPRVYAYCGLYLQTVLVVRLIPLSLFLGGSAAVTGTRAWRSVDCSGWLSGD